MGRGRPKGYVCPPETLARMGRGQKKRKPWKQTPEHIAKRVAACQLTCRLKKEAARLEDQKQAAAALQRPL